MARLATVKALILLASLLAYGALVGAFFGLTDTPEVVYEALSLPISIGGVAVAILVGKFLWR